MFELGKIADTERERLEQPAAASNESDGNQKVAAMTKKQRVYRKRRRSHRAWLYPEDEGLHTDIFWRQTNGEAVYFSRSRRERVCRPRRNQRYDDESEHTSSCAAAAAVRGGMGEILAASDLRAPHGCEPIHRLRIPVVALKETRP